MASASLASAPSGVGSRSCSADSTSAATRNIALAKESPAAMPFTPEPKAAPEPERPADPSVALRAGDNAVRPLPAYIRCVNRAIARPTVRHIGTAGIVLAARNVISGGIRSVEGVCCGWYWLSREASARGSSGRSRSSSGRSANTARRSMCVTRSSITGMWSRICAPRAPCSSTSWTKSRRGGMTVFSAHGVAPPGRGGGARARACR